MAKENYFQISTAIDYPSGRFHLGHAYEKISADILTRWKRAKGFKVHFSTGTDCHGLKIERAAKKAGKSPNEFVKEISEGFKELSKVLDISYDDFIMTIEERHKKVARYILKELQKKNQIYKGFYKGPYCVECETYYTEKDLIGGKCPVHKKQVEEIEEESYFFKLSEYQEFLKNYINEHPGSIWPKKKRKEMLNRLEEPLKDLSISRENVEWGIKLPFDKNLTEFVWFEALNNYLTTIKYPNKKFEDFWPATHFIGPDVTWHHTILWFSILKALNLEIPNVVVHGFINLKGEKLSKSSGIRIDPIGLAKKYSSDSLRYFLMRNIPFGQDGDFSEKVLVNRHNGELLNKLGNLVSRATALAEKNGMGKAENKLLKKLNLKEIKKQIGNYEFDKALNEIFAFIDYCNEFIQKNKLWETKDKKKLFEVLDSIKAITILLWPFIPKTSEKIAKHLGFKVGEDSLKEIDKPLSIKNIKKLGGLFEKL